MTSTTVLAMKLLQSVGNSHWWSVTRVSCQRLWQQRHFRDGVRQCSAVEWQPQRCKMDWHTTVAKFSWQQLWQ